MDARATARRALLGLAAASLATTATLLTTGTAAAQPAAPAGPDRIVVLPGGDAVSVEGYAGRAGSPVTVEVSRPGSGVIGSATGSAASAEALAAGNPVVEVNEAGGLCWGAGSGADVTPDVRPGDTVAVRFGGTVAGQAVVAGAEVTGSSVTGNTLTVRGVLAGVDPAALEVRVAQPGLATVPAIGTRWLGTGQQPAGEVRTGLAVVADTFTATFEFPTREDAELAADGRLAAVSRHEGGVTIAEFGERGGPVSADCPDAALQSPTLSPTNVKATQNGDNLDVTWTPAEQPEGSPAVLGYSVRAVDVVKSAGVTRELGGRVDDPAATSLRLPTTLPGKRIEVRAITAAGESWPPGVPGGSEESGPGDTAVPTAAASPAGGTYPAEQVVTLTASEPGSQIWFTLDGSDPLTARDASATAQLYRGPVTVAPSPTPVVLRYVAFDPAGNPSAARAETYTFEG